MKEGHALNISLIVIMPMLFVPASLKAMTRVYVSAKLVSHLSVPMTTWCFIHAGMEVRLKPAGVILMGRGYVWMNTARYVLWSLCVVLVSKLIIHARMDRKSRGVNVLKHVMIARLIGSV